MGNTSLIVIGGLNTDIVASGIKQFPGAGEHVYGKDLFVGPGGKSRNIADMAGRLLPENTVAMIGRTIKDKYGLWEPPVEALRQAGVNTVYVNVLENDEANRLPAIALIPVNEQGENQIIVLPGVSDDFSTEDIDAAQQLFDEASHNKGFLALTLECPYATAKYAVKKAVAGGIKVMLDPGGVERDSEISELLQNLYLIKPNEHEAKMITGIAVVDFESAGRAAQAIKARGAQNVLITHGDKGAYLFTKSQEVHIPIPRIVGSDDKDATGCGDQVMAALCAYLLAGRTLEGAAELAVLAGTMQFYRAGVRALTKEEIEARL